MKKVGASITVDVGECEAIVRFKAATLADLWDELTKHGLAEPKAERPVLELEEDPGMATPAQLALAWNENRGSLPACRELTIPRQKHCRQRLREQPNLDEWAKVIRFMAMDDFYSGRKPGSTWKADFDYLIRPGTRVKILERMSQAATRKDYGSLLDLGGEDVSSDPNE